ncbi:MAG TPA: hypothetical protein VFB63_00720 [Bryobacteraceae bacterium]|nr:hypothetical protein [Bryobacteraceae bacterium]
MALNGGGNDTQQNCILEVCCGGPNSKQVKALTEVAEHALVFLSHEEAADVAEWIARNWDLAPKGSLYAFKQAIAKLAKGPAYTE